MTYIQKIICLLIFPLALLYNITFESFASGAAFYRKCTFADDYGGIQPSLHVQLSPVSNICRQKCVKSCEGLMSRKKLLQQGAEGTADVWLELNQGAIYGCIVMCQRGFTISFPVKELNGEYSSVEMSDYCLPERSYNVFNVGSFTVTTNSKIVIDLDTEKENKISMGGRAQFEIVPTYPNLLQWAPESFNSDIATKIIQDDQGTYNLNNNYFHYARNSEDKKGLDANYFSEKKIVTSMIDPSDIGFCGSKCSDAKMLERFQNIFGDASFKNWQEAFERIPQYYKYRDLSSSDFQGILKKIKDNCSKNKKLPVNTIFNTHSDSAQIKTMLDYCSAYPKSDYIGMEDLFQSPPQSWRKIQNLVEDPKKTHPLFCTLNNKALNSLSDVHLAYQHELLTQSFPLDDRWGWTIYNSQPVWVGGVEKIRAGDVLMVNWSGLMVKRKDKNVFSDYKSQVMSFFGDPQMVNEEEFSQKELSEMSQLQLLVDDKVITLQGLEKEGASSREECMGKANCMQICGKKFLTQKSTGCFVGDGMSNVDVRCGEQNNSPSIIKGDNLSDDKIDCADIKSPGLPSYTFANYNFPYSGTLKIKHPQDPKKYFGGYKVDIYWEGSNRYNGELLQYQLVKIGEVPLESQWKNIGKMEDGFMIETANLLDITGNKDAVAKSVNVNLFFRFDPEELDKLIVSNAGPDTRSIGAYNLVITQKEKVSSVAGGGCNLMCEIVKTIDETLFGEGGQGDARGISKGIVNKIFQDVIKNNHYINAAYAVMVLALALYAVSIIIGISSLNQKESINFLLKLSFVVILLSPQSWQFFGGYLVPLFVDGSFALTKIFVQRANIMQALNIDLESNKYAIFSFFDNTMDIMFSEASWVRVFTILFASYFGVLFFVAALYGTFLYLSAVIKATVFFIFCLVTTAALIILTPIMLPLFLFQNTKFIFEKWVQNLFSYALQPPVVFSMIVLFNLLIYITIKTIFSFTICPGTCLLNLQVFFNIFSKSIPDFFTDDLMCLLWIPAPLYNLHYPETSNLALMAPLYIIFGSFLMIILPYSMMQFIDMSASLITKILLFKEGTPMQSSAASSATELAGKESGTLLSNAWNSTGSLKARHIAYSASRLLGLKAQKKMLDLAPNAKKGSSSSSVTEEDSSLHQGNRGDNANSNSNNSGNNDDGNGGGGNSNNKAQKGDADNLDNGKDQEKKNQGDHMKNTDSKLNIKNAKDLKNSKKPSIQSVKKEIEMKDLSGININKGHDDMKDSKQENERGKELGKDNEKDIKQEDKKSRQILSEKNIKGNSNKEQ